MSGTKKIIQSLSTLALVGAATLPFGVIADEGRAQAVDSAIEEVMVISSGSIQARLGTSGSITVLDSDEIAKVAATHPSDLLNRVAGVWVNKGSGQEHLTAIRSSIYTGSGACGEFAFLEDGIPLRPHGFCNINNLFELNTEQAAAIEVWRGPASAVLGGNALHGAVNVITPVPSENVVGVEVGPYDFHRVSLQANTQVGDHQFGISLVTASSGGYRADSGYGQQKLHLSHLTDLAGWAVKNQATKKPAAMWAALNLMMIRYCANQTPTPKPLETLGPDELTLNSKKMRGH
jgi:outer membrane cobalamin receptor